MQDVHVAETGLCMHRVGLSGRRLIQAVVAENEGCAGHVCVGLPFTGLVPKPSDRAEKI